MLSNCSAGEDSWESLGLQGDQTVNAKGNQLWIKLIGIQWNWVHWKDWCWSSSALATWCEQLTHWKRPWFWERLRAAEGGSRGWASPTQWTWAWVGSRSWWWTGKPGLQQAMGSQGVRHDWATELNWTELRIQLNLPWSYNSSGVFWFVSSRLPKKQESYLLCWARVRRNGHGLWSQAKLNLYCSSSTHCLCGLWPLTEPLWAFFFNEADIKIPHRTFWGSKMIVDVMFLV